MYLEAMSNATERKKTATQKTQDKGAVLTNLVSDLIQFSCYTHALNVFR